MRTGAPSALRETHSRQSCKSFNFTKGFCTKISCIDEEYNHESTPFRRSETNLNHKFAGKWCCRRDSNSRPLPYQGSALPLSYGSIANMRSMSCASRFFQDCVFCNEVIARELYPRNEEAYVITFLNLQGVLSAVLWKLNIIGN